MVLGRVGRRNLSHRFSHRCGGRGASRRSTNTAALLFAVAGTQLSYVPLVLGPIIDATSRGFGRVSRGWAMATICVGFLVTASAVALSLATADQWWLWAGIPANLGLSVLFVCPRSAAPKRGTAPLSHEAHVKFARLTLQHLSLLRSLWLGRLRVT